MRPWRRLWREASIALGPSGPALKSLHLMPGVEFDHAQPAAPQAITRR